VFEESGPGVRENLSLDYALLGPSPQPSLIYSNPVVPVSWAPLSQSRPSNELIVVR